MRTQAARVAVVGVGAVLGLVVGPVAAADAPTASGWWNLAHQQFQPPPPPDVGADDLFLQGGPGAPSAFAALRFAVDPDATVGPLVLPLASSAAQRADAVVACPTTKAWQPARNARYADAPTYSCARSVAALRSEDGTALVLPNIARLVADDGTLDVALVPGPTDRVVLSPVPATALTVTNPPAGGPATGSGAPPFSEPPPAPAFAGQEPAAPPAPAPGGFASPPLAPAPVTGAPGAPPAGTTPLISPPSTAVPPVASPQTRPVSADDTRTRVLVAAEAVLVLAFFGLLGYGPLSRLHALTGEPAPVAERPRGIGRFASVRPTTRPPRL